MAASSPRATSSKAARPPEPFWRGAIQSQRHARKILHRAVWIFLIWAAFFALPLVRHFTMHAALPVAMFVAPALALLWIQDTLLAGMLLALCSIYTTGSVMFIIDAAATADPRGGLYTLAFLFWLALTLAAWRAFIAARYLNSNRPAETQA
jgi:hypothetical protein